MSEIQCKFPSLLIGLKTLTVINNLHCIDFQPLTKKLQNDLKKNAKKSTSYQKNAYLCSVSCVENKPAAPAVEEPVDTMVVDTTAVDTAAAPVDTAAVAE